jgi:hypothetical protein
MYGHEGFVPGAGSSSGANPMLLPPNLPASAPVANPYSTSVVPTFGANTGGYSSSGGSLLPTGGTNATGGKAADPFGYGTMTDKDKSRLFSGLKNAYGDGMAHLLMDFLAGGAGYNQQAINNLLASMQPGIERGTQSLMEQFSTSGNRFGSGAQIGLADFLSQVNLNEGQLITQMYENSLNDYMNVLMGTSQQAAKEKQSSSTIWDSLSGALSPIIGGSSLGGLFGIGKPSSGPGGSSSNIMDIISSLGGGGGGGAALPLSLGI